MIYLRGKTKHIGYYDTLEDAIEARKTAEIKYYAPIIKEYENETNN